MSPLSDATAEHKRREAIANLLLNRIALGLIQDARQRCGFGEDEVRLQSLADRLAAEFADRTGAEPRQSPVELELHSGGRIKLAVPFGERCRKWAELREDGVVLGGGTSESSDTRTLRPEDMAPWEREEQRRRDLARKAARGKPKFRGKQYLRTLAAPAQPGAKERILAIELYADGLLVEFTYDTELGSEKQEESDYYPPRPPMRVEDDVGTDYYEGEQASYGGGPGASHSYFTFAPAVPAAVRVLRIVTDSGTVEVATQA